MDLLLNTIMLSVPISGSHGKNFLSFSHGEYFYSLFQATVNTELLRSLEATVPRLTTVSSQNPATVSSLAFFAKDGRSCANPAVCVPPPVPRSR